MAIKLNELYKSIIKKDMKLIAGKNGMNNVVRWAHMIESVEISTFLEGQELAFTTGIALEKKEDLYDLVRHTYQNNASGMVINIGPYIEKIPENIIKFCNDQDFPLFEVPWHVYMANIMKDFGAQITMSDRINIELSSAIKNAIFFPTQHELYIPHLESHDFNANWSYCIAIMEILEKDKKTIINSKKRSKVLKCIENIITSSCERTFAFELDGKFILVFAEHSQEKIKNIAKEINSKCSDILSNNEEISLCIGENTKDVKCIARSYRQSMDVLKLQKRKHFNNKIGMYRDLGMHKLLLSIEDKEIIDEFYRETIEKLVKNDELKGTDYIKVLDSYLKNSGSIKAVAEQLFYHRNTICYKINKIEEILSCNLSELETKINLSIALMLREIS